MQAKDNAGLNSSQSGKEVDGFCCVLVVEPTRLNDGWDMGVVVVGGSCICELEVLVSGPAYKGLGSHYYLLTTSKNLN